MMGYEVFKKVVTTRIKEFLPSVYAEFDVEVVTVPKINGMREAMVLTFETDGCRMSGPNIYFDDLYAMFSDSGELEGLLDSVAELIVECTGTQNFSKHSSFSLKNYRENIVHMLISTEMNIELLKTVPHREFLDLSVIYRLAIPDPDGCGYTTALITNDMLSELEVTVEELDELAEKNSRKELPTQVFNIGPFLSMMTTEAKMYGAINLLRLDEIRKVADKMNGNLYILPSSVHDLMVLKDNKQYSEGGFFEMVKSGNKECNAIDENLSANIYYYDRTKDRVDVIYSNKNKRN